ncbi:MAG: arginine-tRNA-protein transferase [Benniella sp.]|nr:MAG: arginine-tRNA-protein transferase [Benniella sp.]
MLLSDYSLVSPNGTNVSKCGYCKSLAGSRTYGMIANLMTCKDYQALINRGWRRSGRYIYKPNLRDSCCPQYTIRMEAGKYEASKHQRQIVNRFNKFIQEGDENFDKDIASRRLEESSMAVEPQDASTAETLPSTGAETSMEIVEGKKQKPKKPPKNVTTDLKTRIRSSEYLHSPEITSWKHRLRIKLEPSSFTDEKHALYVKYQMAVHKEPRSRCSAYGFTNFLVDTALTATKKDDWTEEDPGFGSFHQCYYLDEQLIAVSVIDILPECISAVYFMYDPVYSVLSLGKYSAQREIALAQTLNAKPGYENLKYYYMGFHIFSCPKMTYKSQFHPSYLLDPETYNWIEFKKCQEIIQEKRFTCFENPVPMDPLFEAKIQSIANKKQGYIDTSDCDSEMETEEEDNDGQGQDMGDSNEASPVRERKKASREKAKRSEIDRVFRETTALPPVGCLDPKDVTESDLISVLSMSQQKLRPVVVSDHPPLQVWLGVLHRHLLLQKQCDPNIALDVF